jgi:hypothetical protein
MHELTRRTPLTLNATHRPPVQRMPAIMDDYILPDMGRMTARLCSIGRTRSSPATIKGRKTGQPSPRSSRPANCTASIRYPTSPTCSPSSSISGQPRASTSSCPGPWRRSGLPVALRRNRECDSGPRSIHRKIKPSEQWDRRTAYDGSMSEAGFALSNIAKPGTISPTLRTAEQHIGCLVELTSQ